MYVKFPLEIHRPPHYKEKPSSANRIEIFCKNILNSKLKLDQNGGELMSQNGGELMSQNGGELMSWSASLSTVLQAA